MTAAAVENAGRRRRWSVGLVVALALPAAAAVGGFERAAAQDKAAAEAAGARSTASAPPAAPAPPGEQDRARDGAVAAPDAPRAGAASGAGNAMPLDTRITVTPDTYGTRPAGAVAERKRQTVIFRPSRQPGAVVPAVRPHAFDAANGTAAGMNAVGARGQNRAAGPGVLGRSEARNAVGGIAASPAVRGAAAAASFPQPGVKNAVGASLPIRPAVPAAAARAAPNAVAARTATVGPAAAGAANHAAINGRDAIHPGVNAAALGGPAKRTLGALNGTDFRRRHP